MRLAEGTAWSRTRELQSQECRCVPQAREALRTVAVAVPRPPSPRGPGDGGSGCSPQLWGEQGLGSEASGQDRLSPRLGIFREHLCPRFQRAACERTGGWGAEGDRGANGKRPAGEGAARCQWDGHEKIECPGSRSERMR